MFSVLNNRGKISIPATSSPSNPPNGFKCIGHSLFMTLSKLLPHQNIKIKMIRTRFNRMENFMLQIFITQVIDIYIFVHNRFRFSIKPYLLYYL